jgi:hypothetical protein
MTNRITILIDQIELEDLTDNDHYLLAIIRDLKNLQIHLLKLINIERITNSTTDSYYVVLKAIVASIDNVLGIYLSNYLSIYVSIYLSSI